MVECIQNGGHLLIWDAGSLVEVVNFVDLPPEAVVYSFLAFIEVADVKSPALFTVILGPCGLIGDFSVEI